MIKEAIAKVVERIDLKEEEAEQVMREIMEGKATPAQIASYITALRMKGESVAEITGSAKVMREKAVRVRVSDPMVVDTCGTGGDRLHTFNISTTVAFVVAGCGVTVAKHGNRSVSSSCGSADVLKTLGIQIDLPPERVEACINDIGIGFLFAPLFHGAMKHAVAPRQETGIRTIFNILGPLTNPAGATVQVLGVFSSIYTELMAQVLLNLGSRHCFVVHGADGLDEITITGKSRISEGKGGRVLTYPLEPKDFQLPGGSLKDLAGGNADVNAAILLDILKGEQGPKRDVVLMNAAPALVAVGKAKTLQEGVHLAEESIDSGRAMGKLEALKEMTNK
ncbi:MAG: anthranilate phosphoribosyltransferase [Candidatus Manganitrophus sp.]|nr:anthranilate phosphoribosyltransferase [Candidatus Manganitrophus sp.]WDT71100.1 MAG: anthranilate phosphoribosyltransferase [Candidatus Manganitrophus sp.]WDT76651.1 MAG: anthranilate phosphoribosyltransferase [Candidatus Manganitrophus sp.]